MAKVSYLLICVLFYGVCGLRVELDEEWEMYKKTFNKTYNSDCQEKMKRRYWEENLEFIIRHNLEADMGVHNFTAGLNEFSDMNFGEFATIMAGSFKHNETIPDDAEMFVPPPDVKINASVDYRKLGMVTEPGNQGQCGSCYAFCTTASLEAMHKKKKEKLIKLSEQNIIDCSQSLGNKDCDGGSPAHAMTYAIKNGGLDTSESYPFEGKAGQCRFNVTNVVRPGCKRVMLMKKNNETDLRSTVGIIGPVVVSMNGQSRLFQHYRGGIFSDPTCNKQPVNHCVTIIGYGTKNGTDYWIIKNSWGTSWGERGFFRMVRNKNMCNLTKQPVLCQ